jgi:hypothetical protein
MSASLLMGRLPSSLARSRRAGSIRSRTNKTDVMGKVGFIPLHRAASSSMFAALRRNPI